jgi:hypothetical protein
MLADYQRTLTHCRLEIAQGATSADILALLHDPAAYPSDAYTPNSVEALKALRDLYHLDLGEALRMLHDDPTWADHARHIIS